MWGNLLTFHPWPSWYRRWFSQIPSSDHFRIFFSSNFLADHFPWQMISLGILTSNLDWGFLTEVIWITDMLLITCKHSQLEAHFPGESHCSRHFEVFSWQIGMALQQWSGSPLGHRLNRTKFSKSGKHQSSQSSKKYLMAEWKNAPRISAPPAPPCGTTKKHSSTGFWLNWFFPLRVNTS